jgi:hypothetical protein
MSMRRRLTRLKQSAPVREPEEEKVPIGLALPDMTMDQFHGHRRRSLARRDRV